MLVDRNRQCFTTYGKDRTSQLCVACMSREYFHDLYVFNIHSNIIWVGCWKHTRNLHYSCLFFNFWGHIRPQQINITTKLMRIGPQFCIMITTASTPSRSPKSEWHAGNTQTPSHHMTITMEATNQHQTYQISVSITSMDWGTAHVRCSMTHSAWHNILQNLFHSQRWVRHRVNYANLILSSPFQLLSLDGEVVVKLLSQIIKLLGMLLIQTSLKLCDGLLQLTLFSRNLVVEVLPFLLAWPNKKGHWKRNGITLMSLSAVCISMARG